MSSWSLFAKPKPTPAIGPWVRSLDDEKYWQLFQEVEAKDKGTLLKEAQKRDVPAWIQETVEYGIEQQAARERKARNLALQKLGALSPETIERRAAEERGRGYLKDDDYLDTSLRSGSGGSGLFGSKRPVSARRKAREAQLRSARKSAEGRSKVADKLRAAEAADFIPYGRAWAAVDDDDERNADEIVGNNGDDNKFRVLAIAGVSSDGNCAGVRVGRSTRTDESIVQAEKDRRNAAKALAKVPAHLHDVDQLSDEDEAVTREARNSVKEKVAKTFGVGGHPHGRGPLADEDVTTTGSAAPAPSAAAMKKTASALTSSLSRPYGWRRAIADFFHLTSKPDGEWNEAEHVKKLRRSKENRGHHLNRADDLHHVTERNDAPVVHKLLLEKTLRGEMSVQAFDRAQQNQSREGLLHSVLDRFDESEFFHIHSVLQRKKEADASRLGRGGGSPPRSAANADYVRQLAGIPPDVLRLIDKRRQEQAQREEDERNWGNPVWVQRENLANRIIDSVAYEASSTDLEVLEMGDPGGSSTSVVDATNTAVDAKTRGSRLSLVSSRSSAAGQDADESRSILSASTATLQRHGVDVSKTIAEKPAQEPQRGDFLSDDNLRRLDLQTGRAARKPCEGAGESHEEDGRGGGGAICSVDLNTEEEDDEASLLAQDGLDVVRNGVFKGGPAAARYAERTRPTTAQDERDEHDAHLLWRNPRAAPRGPKADEKQQLEVLTAQKKNSSLWMRFGYQKQQAQRKPNKRDMQVIDELKSEVQVLSPRGQAKVRERTRSPETGEFKTRQHRPKQIGLVSPADADIVNGTATERRRAAMLKVEDVADADNSPDWSTRRGYYKDSTRGKNAPHLLYAPLASRSAIIIRNTLFNFGEGEAAAEKRGVGGSPAASAASNEAGSCKDDGPAATTARACAGANQRRKKNLKIDTRTPKRPVSTSGRRRTCTKNKGAMSPKSKTDTLSAKTNMMNRDKELFEALSPRQQFRQTKPPSEARILMHHVAPRVAGPPPALSAGTIISSGLTLADLEHRFPDAVHCSGFLPVAGGAAVSGEKSDTLQSQWTMNRSRTSTRSKEEPLRDLADENHATTSETDEAASSKAVAIGNGLAPLIRLISSGSCEGTHNAAATPRSRSSSPDPGKTILERTANPRRKLGDIEGRLIRFEICQVKVVQERRGNRCLGCFRRAWSACGTCFSFIVPGPTLMMLRVLALYLRLWCGRRKPAKPPSILGGLALGIMRNETKYLDIQGFSSDKRIAGEAANVAWNDYIREQQNCSPSSPPMQHPRQHPFREGLHAASSPPLDVDNDIDVIGVPSDIAAPELPVLDLGAGSSPSGDGQEEQEVGLAAGASSAVASSSSDGEFVTAGQLVSREIASRARTTPVAPDHDADTGTRSQRSPHMVPTLWLQVQALHDETTAVQRASPTQRRVQEDVHRSKLRTQFLHDAVSARMREHQAYGDPLSAADIRARIKKELGDERLQPRNSNIVLQQQVGKAVTTTDTGGGTGDVRACTTTVVGVNNGASPRLPVQERQVDERTQQGQCDGQEGNVVERGEGAEPVVLSDEKDSKQLRDEAEQKGTEQDEKDRSHKSEQSTELFFNFPPLPEKDEEQEKLLDILAGYGLTERQGKIVRNPFRGGRKPILPKRDFVREDVRKNHLPVDTVSALLNACDASAHGALLREYRHCESAPAGGAAAAVAESPFSWTLNIVPRKPISMGARLALEKQSSPGRGNGNHKHNMMIQEHQVQDCEREPPSAVTAPARSVGDGQQLALRDEEILGPPGPQPSALISLGPEKFQSAVVLTDDLCVYVNGKIVRTRFDARFTREGQRFFDNSEAMLTAGKVMSIFFTATRLTLYLDHVPLVVFGFTHKDRDYQDVLTSSDPRTPNMRKLVTEVWPLVGVSNSKSARVKELRWLGQARRAAPTNGDATTRTRAAAGVENLPSQKPLTEDVERDFLLVRERIRPASAGNRNDRQNVDVDNDKYVLADRLLRRPNAYDRHLPLRFQVGELSTPWRKAPYPSLWAEQQAYLFSRIKYEPDARYGNLGEIVDQSTSGSGTATRAATNAVGGRGIMKTKGSVSFADHDDFDENSRRGGRVRRYPAIRTGSNAVTAADEKITSDVGLPHGDKMKRRSPRGGRGTPSARKRSGGWSMGPLGNSFVFKNRRRKASAGASASPPTDLSIVREFLRDSKSVDVVREYKPPKPRLYWRNKDAKPIGWRQPQPVGSQTVHEVIDESSRKPLRRSVSWAPSRLFGGRSSQRGSGSSDSEQLVEVVEYSRDDNEASSSADHSSDAVAVHSEVDRTSGGGKHDDHVQHGAKGNKGVPFVQTSSPIAAQRRAEACHSVRKEISSPAPSVFSETDSEEEESRMRYVARRARSTFLWRHAWRILVSGILLTIATWNLAVLPLVQKHKEDYWNPDDKRIFFSPLFGFGALVAFLVWVLLCWPMPWTASPEERARTTKARRNIFDLGEDDLTLAMRRAHHVSGSRAAAGGRSSSAPSLRAWA